MNTENPRDILTIKEVAEMISRTVPTVEYYTNRGLFVVKERISGIRYYDKKDIEKRWVIISELLSAGYTVVSIKEELRKKNFKVG